MFTRSGGTWGQQVELTASDGAASDSFGAFVAVSGDLIAVGSPYKDVGSNMNQGVTYIYQIGTDLESGDGAAGDEFGFSVGLSGNTAVVGAPDKTIGTNTKQGAAYVFVQNGATSWSQQQKLTASDGAAGNEFGLSVAISGNTVVVGAPYKTVSGHSNQGAAYVFVRSGSTWSQQQEITASDGVASDLFGYSVSVSGNTIVAGAGNKTVGVNSGAGASYVFVYNGSTWGQQQELTASNGATNDFFGWSVAVSGDTAVVGAYGKTISGHTAAGAAYVFVRSGSTWSQQQEITASDGAALDEFGSTVAISGNTVVVGAPYKTVSGHSNQGAAYVFVRSGSTWSQQTDLIASDGASGDTLGTSVAISGDTIATGAPGKTVGRHTNQGVIYFYGQSPTAAYDTYSTSVNTTLTVSAANGVLANDSDPNSLSLTASLFVGPSHGSLTLNSNGSFTYIPNTGFSGTDGFFYQASDGVDNSDLAFVRINVN